MRIGKFGIIGIALIILGGNRRLKMADKKCKNCGHNIKRLFFMGKSHWVHRQSAYNSEDFIECYCGCTNPQPKEAKI